MAQLVAANIKVRTLQVLRCNVAQASLRSIHQTGPTLPPSAGHVNLVGAFGQTGHPTHGKCSPVSEK